MKKYILLLLLISPLVTASTAIAQTPELNIEVSPPLTHIIIRPGKSALSTVNIENRGLFDVRITPNLVDFSSDDHSGIPVLSETISFPYIELKDDIATLNDSFELASGSKKQLLFEINLPENSIEKEYHFSLRLGVEPIQNALKDSSKSQVQGNIVTNFIVTISESSQDQGKIQLKSFESPLFLDSLSPIMANITVENVGKNTTVTQGDLKIQNALGKTVYQSEILPQNILPNSARKLVGAQSVTKDSQEYAEEIPFRYKPLFLLGPYTILLTYHAPGQEPQTFAHRVFALPVSVLITIVLAYIVYLIYTKQRFFR